MTEREEFEKYRDARNRALIAEGHGLSRRHLIDGSHFATWQAARAGMVEQCTHLNCGQFYDHNARRMECKARSDDACAVDHPAPSAPEYPTHITEPGESVAGIALRQLGDESRWREIRDLNAMRAVVDMGPHDYYPVGTVLRLPDDEPTPEGAPDEH